MTPERLAEIRAVNRSMKFVSAKHVEGVIVELADALEASWASLDNVRASNRFLENRIAEYAHDAEQQRERAERAEAELEAFRDSGLFEMWTQDRARAERAEAALDRVRDLCDLVETYDHPVAWHTEIRAAIEGDNQ